MIEITTENLLADAAVQVLEAMFFCSVEPEPVAGLPEPTLKVEVAFHGEIAGRLQVLLDHAFARVLAANFTAHFDPLELGEVEVEQVACELANMLCGATLSRLSPGTIFDLDSPHVSGTSSPPETGRWIHTADGSLHLDLRWEHRA